MGQQVTGVIGLAAVYRRQNSRIPLWTKIVFTAFLALWIPTYWRQYGGQNFLYFCDLGNLLVGAGLWMESRLLVSIEAVGLLLFQTLYTLDLVGAVLFGKHLIGGTEYMLDGSIPLPVRLLGLYHLVMPPLLLWAVRRLGYDPRGWKWQTLLTALVVPINHFWRPASNVNWARGLGHEQHFMPGWLYLMAYLVVVPLVVYWPTHLALKWWSGESANAQGGDAG